MHIYIYYVYIFIYLQLFAYIWNHLHKIGYEPWILWMPATLAVIQHTHPPSVRWHVLQATERKSPHAAIFRPVPSYMGLSENRVYSQL